MTTDPKCGRSWSGTGPEHCTACHETFGSTEAGDRHRVGTFEPYTRRCLTLEEYPEAGLIPNARGHWVRDPAKRQPRNAPESCAQSAGGTNRGPGLHLDSHG